MLIKYQSNNASLESDYIKVPRPITIRVNEIEEETSVKFFDDFQRAIDTGQNIIPIIIDSYGGEAYTVFAMSDLIRKSPVTVMTIVSGKACSAGAILLSCGHEGYRYASPNASIMLHDVSAGADGKIEDMKASLKEIERINVQMYNILDSNCGQTPGFFKKKISKLKNVDYWISPDLSKEMNLINHIGLPDLTFNINAGFILPTEELPLS